MGEREAAIRRIFDSSGLGLEIGPSYNPIVPKRDGYKVHIVDHASTEDLRSKYANEKSVDATQIEEVDFVWDGRPLPEVVGARGAYDYVVASHVIEHTPDILGFLRDCAALLKPDGVLVLAVPDMRRCFDIFRPLTSTGQALQAHLERRKLHAPATAFDHGANMAVSSGVSGWGKGHKGSLALNHDLKFAKYLFDRSANTKEYHDFHAWVFTPASFRLLIQDLNNIGELPLQEQSFEETPSIEFWIVLSRTAEGPKTDRLTLLNQVHADMREVLDQAPT